MLYKSINFIAIKNHLNHYEFFPCSDFLYPLNFLENLVHKRMSTFKILIYKNDIPSEYIERSDYGLLYDYVSADSTFNFAHKLDINVLKSLSVLLNAMNTKKYGSFDILDDETFLIKTLGENVIFSFSNPKIPKKWEGGFVINYELFKKVLESSYFEILKLNF